jgi:hypothetical protein
VKLLAERVEEDVQRRHKVLVWRKSSQKDDLSEFETRSE